MKSADGRRLRVAVLTRNFNSVGGGAERYSIALAVELSARHEVHVYAQQMQFQGHGITLHKVPQFLSRPRWVNQLWFALATWWMTRSGYDVVHSHELTWHGDVQTIHVVPVRFSLFDGLSSGALWLRWLKVITSPRLLTYILLEHFRFSARPAKCIALASPSQLKSIESAYPNALPACQVIAPGVSVVDGPASRQMQTHARQRLNLPEVGRCVLFVGNDFRKKGLPALIEALSLLPSDVFVAVVGNAQQKNLVQAQVAHSNVNHRVFFVGELTDMESAYHAADCLAHPTLEDTFAMVVLEAFSHGVPVVVSTGRYCGIASMLSDREQALLLDDPRDAASLATSLRLVLDDALVADRLRQKGLEFARQHLWSAIAQQQDAIYVRVVGSKMLQRS